jgi:hypothetical protein
MAASRLAGSHAGTQDEPVVSGTGFCFYREVQRFRQPWLWLLIAGIFGVTVWSFVQQIIMSRPFGQNTAPDTAIMIIAFVFGLAFPLLFLVANLTTEVRSDGLYYRFFPFHWSFHRISTGSLAKYEVQTYRPIRDYGGWGIRYGHGSKAYNVSGNRGVMLELSDGQKLLIGSQKPDDLANAISLAFAKKPG